MDVFFYDIEQIHKLYELLYYEDQSKLLLINIKKKGKTNLKFRFLHLFFIDFLII